jgi:YD repeat-containing protein
MNFPCKCFLFSLVLSVPLFSDAQIVTLLSPITPNTAPGSGGIVDQSVDMVNLRTDIIPHSPEAEALGKYSVLPVTLYSGMPSISVPIFEIKSSSLDLPFSLTYNNNGYKPNEIASWTGLGWTLEGGGVITRIVKDQVDESMAGGAHYDDFININLMVWNQPFLTELAMKQVDSEPDVYIFHVGGYSGKFIMLKGQAYLFPYQNLRIVPFGAGFKMTDDKGNNYTFTSTETTHQKAMTPGSLVPDHTSAWFVTQVISADTKDTVLFNYQSYTYFQPANYVETYKIDGSISNGLNTSGHTFTEYAIQGDHIDGLLLSSVTSRFGNIYFSPSAADRSDLINSIGAKSLDNILVTGSDGAYNKQLKLYHSYFGSGTNMRLNLQGVTIQQSNPLADSSRYTFQYAGSTGVLPANGTKGIDKYGYYNGADGNFMLFPAGTFTPSLYQYGNRNANSSSSQLCMLNQVNYPTGGYSQLAYEQNQAGLISYKSSPATIAVTDAYVRQDTMANGTTYNGFYLHLDSSQYVKLNMSTFVDNYTGPLSLLTVATGNNLNGIGGTQVYSSPAGQNYLVDSVFLIAGDYTVNLYAPSIDVSVTGTANYIAHVVNQNTLSDGPGLRIKSIVSFNYDGTPLLTKHYFYNYGSGFSGGGVTANSLFANCAQYSIMSYMAGLKSPLSEFSQEQFYYQQVEEDSQDPTQTGKTNYTYSAVGGQLQLDVKLTSQTESIYKNFNYLPLKNTTYQYQTTQVNDFTATEVLPMTVIGNVCSGCFGCPELASPDATQAADLLTIYGPTNFSDMQSAYTVTTHEIETDYDSVGNPALTNQTDYYYDNPSHIFPTRLITTNSKGEQMTTQLSYPLDYVLGQTSSLSGLNTAFIANLGLAGNAMNSCVVNEENALQPYQPYHNNTPANQTQFASIAAAYNCQTTFSSTVASAISGRSSAWTSYLSYLDGAMVSNTTPWQQGVLWMQRNNMVSPTIEKYVTLKEPDGNVYLVSATRNEYNILANSAGIKSALPSRISQVELTAPLLMSTFTAGPDSYYKPELNFGYDARFNLVVQNKINGKKMSYLWNYGDVYPVAQVVNADTNTIAYTSFEADKTGRWVLSGTPSSDPTAITGKQSYALNGTNPVSTSGLNSSQSYIVSYWTKNAAAFTIAGTQAGYPLAGRSYNGWKYFEHKITGQTSVTINGTGQIDELRLYPSTAQMTTYAYNPIMGMTSQCDMDNRIMYYEYDGIGRLRDIRDQDGNIVKTIEYHFFGL